MLKASAAQGVAPDNVAGHLLDRWLLERPDAELADAWKRQMQALWPSLSPQEREEIRNSALERARSVAEAVGGFLGSDIADFPRGKGGAGRFGTGARGLTARETQAACQVTDRAHRLSHRRTGASRFLIASAALP